MTSNFELLILATNWGYEGDLESYFERVKKEGYDGIEIWWPMKKNEQEDLFSLLEKYSLRVGFLCGSDKKNWKEHFEEFQKMVESAAMNSAQFPLYINCHSGKDYFSFEENCAFIELTNALSNETGVLICHETHRSRLLYSAPAARKYFQEFPDLKVTFDVSHWCNVSESLMEGQEETIQMAVEKAEHIHARIGHPQGPQVNDPRAPEWKAAVDFHLDCWDRIIDRKRKEKGKITFLTEFGPPDYMPTLPYNRKPVSDQWEINVYMLRFLRSRYALA